MYSYLLVIIHNGRSYIYSTPTGDRTVCPLTNLYLISKQNPVVSHHDDTVCFASIVRQWCNRKSEDRTSRLASAHFFYIHHVGFRSIETHLASHEVLSQQRSPRRHDILFDCRSTSSGCLLSGEASLYESIIKNQYDSWRRRSFSETTYFVLGSEAAEAEAAALPQWWSSS
jgi:hypothetical protein